MLANNNYQSIKLALLFVASLQLTLLTVSCAPNVAGTNYADSKALAVISDEDLTAFNDIKLQIESLSFKSIEDVLSYLQKIRSLLQKHPKNTAFATGEQAELHRFLSSEAITKLARLDTDPFTDINSEEKIQIATSAVLHDELTKKLFDTPLMNMIEKRRMSNKPDSSHEGDKNFFASLWCKLSNCNQQ